MKYKVGDKVRIKSIDWYNKNKDEYGNIDISHDFTFYADRSKHCGKVFTIDVVFDNCYTVKEDNHEYYWSDEMIEGLVEEESLTPPLKHPEDSALAMLFHKTLILPEGYQFVDENGNVINATKIVLEKKKKEYPKTYEECCKVMNYCCNPLSVKTTHKEELIRRFQFLLLYRDAYWKIAGEDMGLGKPWEPNLLNDNQDKFVLANWDNNIDKHDYSTNKNYILTFPTEEMRDAFYENFKEEIEMCKELL